MSHPLNSPPFNIFNNISVSGSASAGVATFTSSISAILARHMPGYQVNYTGSPQGVLQFNICNDYNPQLPQSANSFNSSANGTWVTISSTSIPAPGGSPVFLDAITAGAYIQAQFISATSSGVISGWYVAKSMG